MAKYTEILAEYLENGGTLPSAFSTIEGFEDSFIYHYCDKEIGMETETLFAIKLEEKANIYIPLYKERIEALATAYTHVKQPAKIFYETHSLTMTIGEQDTNVKNVPFNASNANPSTMSHADESVNTNEEEHRKEDSGFTPDEAMRVYDFINGKVKSLVDELLGVFKDCFMGVY